MYSKPLPLRDVQGVADIAVQLQRAPYVHFLVLRRRSLHRYFPDHFHAVARDVQGVLRHEAPPKHRPVPKQSDVATNKWRHAFCAAEALAEQFRLLGCVEEVPAAHAVAAVGANAAVAVVTKSPAPGAFCNRLELRVEAGAQLVVKRLPSHRRRAVVDPPPRRSTSADALGDLFQRRLEARGVLCDVGLGRLVATGEGEASEP